MAKKIWAAGDQVLAADLNGNFPFGGNGADGALSITSGTTTQAMGSVIAWVKNYTSISITGTGKLAFSGPNSTGTAIILKSQAGVTLTSSQTPMLDASGMGASGGTGITGNPGNGNSGNNGNVFLILTNAGGGGQGQGTGGTAGAVSSAVKIPSSVTPYLLKYPNAWVGAGGGSGGSAFNILSGVGGAGGGCLIIECAGAWNFTTANGISVAGAVGGNGSAAQNIGGGGGGGGGGYFLALYGSLTANSGTVNVAGGVGGNDSSGISNSIAGGGGGSSGINAGNAGIVGTTSGQKAGGDGGAGLSTIAANTEFA